VKHINTAQKTTNTFINIPGCKVKRCTSCLVDIVYPVNINPSNYRASTYICRTCDNKKSYIREQKRREKKIIGDSQHIQDLLDGIRKSAKQRNLPFKLKVSDIKPLITKRCPVLNIKYVLNKKDLTWGSKEGQNDWSNSLSIDRIDNSKGYVPDNIIVVSMLANAIKNQATPEDILKVGKFYKKLYKQKGLNHDK
jgi:hypothetical protein